MLSSLDFGIARADMNFHSVVDHRGPWSVSLVINMPFLVSSCTGLESKSGKL
jgi:hypothetical protein